MGSLRLSLSLRLNNHNLQTHPRPEGVLFHQWVPDGEADAISLTADNDPNRLRVWFERLARNRTGLLEWDAQGQDFDAAIMERQSKLEVGQLSGELILEEVSTEEWTALQRNLVERGQPVRVEEHVEDAACNALAKRIIKLIQPPVSRFLNTLRNQYGQHWLPELTPWDSRREKLGSYCAQLGLHWFHEERDVWYRLIPTNFGFTIVIQPLGGRAYADLLTERDWRHLQATRCLKEIPLELHLLGEASRFLHAQDFRQAFVAAASALDIALSRRLRVPSGASQVLRSTIQSFVDKQGLSTGAAITFLLAGTAREDIEIVLDTLRIRNGVVHEGYLPNQANVIVLRRFMGITSRFIGLPEFKAPELTNGNSLAPSRGQA
jgi:hypothetical protein